MYTVKISTIMYLYYIYIDEVNYNQSVPYKKERKSLVLIPCCCHLVGWKAHTFSEDNWHCQYMNGTEHDRTSIFHPVHSCILWRITGIIYPGHSDWILPLLFLRVTSIESILESTIMLHNDTHNCYYYEQCSSKKVKLKTFLSVFVHCDIVDFFFPFFFWAHCL